MSNSERIEKVRELLSKFQEGMLVTEADTGEFHGRPMMIAMIDQDGVMSFITALQSAKVDEVLRNPHVGLTLQSKGAFMSVVGMASIVVDIEEKKRVWNQLDEVWFEDPADPEAALIQVRPTLVEYWDNRGVNALRFAFEAVRAAARGEAPRDDERRHGTVRF